MPEQSGNTPPQTAATPTIPAAAAAQPPKAPTQPSFMMNLLNGIAIGAVCALIPGALLGELVRALLPAAPWLQIVLNATAVSNAMMGLVVGVMVGINFKFSPIQCAAVGVATQFAAGAVTFEGAKRALAGTGDVITMGVTAAAAVGLIKLLGNSLKAYTILVIPVAVLAVAGVAGRLALPAIMQITHWIGVGVSNLLTLQPIVMAMLIAMIFSILIVSPITTVGIALAISLSGIGSGAGNLGVCAAGFGLAIAGWKVNTHGTSLAHFIGSPKMSMANVIKKPKIMLPILCSAALTGILGALLNITGTPMSAGFGFSGLVGPLAYFGLQGWSLATLLKALLAFVVAPVGFGLIFNRLFTRVLKITKPEDYYLDVR